MRHFATLSMTSAIKSYRQSLIIGSIQACKLHHVQRKKKKMRGANFCQFYNKLTGMTGSRFDLAYIELTLFIDVSAPLNMTRYARGYITINSRQSHATAENHIFKSCKLLYKYLLAINDADTFFGFCHLAALEVIHSFHLSVFTFQLSNVGCAGSIANLECRT